ncbi:unnamed protein product [Tuber aestivum]|uniref:Uncharacterized protein n=1 Tax=Tuber aestivum TaxID=59557 RepID=A0A292PJU1_9PEZI|nr:unnamed protein product [Tuber aestivum]
MSRILTRPAVRAFSTQFRLSTGALRYVHSERVPYSGPPSYDTLNRRFSSDINPHTYVSHQHAKAAKERGEIFDIHDSSGVDPLNFDVLIADVDDKVLRGKISEVVGIPYHSKATIEDAGRKLETGYCYLYGESSRIIFPTVVSNRTRAHWVFFVVETGAPWTHLSARTCELLGFAPEQAMPNLVTIAGYTHPIYRSPRNKHFSDLNLLGMDFFSVHRISQWNDFLKRRAILFFGTKWEPPRKVES